MSIGQLLHRGDIRTIQDRVADHLRRLVLDGVLQPGDRLNPGQLAHDLGTSTTPVREAFHQLEAEGFVVFHPYRGVYVAPLVPERIEEIYIVRAALEEFAVGLAVDRLRPEDFASMELQLAAMATAVERGAPAEFHAANHAFHETIYAAAGRPTLYDLVRDLRTRSYRYGRIYQALPGAMERGLKQHRVIVEACRQRNRGLAKRLTKAHVLGLAGRVVKLLRQNEQQEKLARERGSPTDPRAGTT